MNSIAGVRISAHILNTAIAFLLFFAFINKKSLNCFFLLHCLESYYSLVAAEYGVILNEMRSMLDRY